MANKLSCGLIGEEHFLRLQTILTRDEFFATTMNTRNRRSREGQHIGSTEQIIVGIISRVSMAILLNETARTLVFSSTPTPMDKILDIVGAHFLKKSSNAYFELAKISVVVGVLVPQIPECLGNEI